VGEGGRGEPAVDWTAVERMPEFRELVSSRRRFAWTAGSIGIGMGALYVVLAGVAPDLMGTHVFGSMSLGYVAGVALILLTWLITRMYMQRSDRVWGPLEEEVRRKALGHGEPRFTSDDDAARLRRLEAARDEASGISREQVRR
jgi:uncharacterized membrane protein (DUF485 family)